MFKLSQNRLTEEVAGKEKQHNSFQTEITKALHKYFENRRRVREEENRTVAIKNSKCNKGSNFF